MARAHARIKFSIWDDEDFLALSPHAKLTYIMLISEPALNQAGVVLLRLPLWAETLGLKESEVMEALAELDDAGFALTDERTSELLVRTFIRNDGVADQPNILKGALQNARQLRSQRLRTVLAAELRRLPPKPPDRPKFSYPDPHACAAELDPDWSPDPFDPTSSKGSRNPSANPSGNPFGKASANPSAEDRVTASDNPQTGTLPGRLPETLPGRDAGRVRGRGRGGGDLCTPGSTNEVGSVLPREKTRGTHTSHGSRIPAEFVITPAMAEWAREHTPDLDLAYELDQFRDFWAAKSGKDATKLDWVATWRTWMRRSQKQAAQRQAPGPRLATGDRKVLEAQALKARFANNVHQLPQGSAS